MWESTSGTITYDDAATVTARGQAELATAAETTTGTDAVRTVTPDGLAGSDYGKRVMTIIIDAPTVALSTGDGQVYFRLPATLNGWNLVAVSAQVVTVSSSGLPTFQIHNLTDAVDVLSTVLTIDASELDSSTATTPAVINAANDDVDTADQWRIDCDVAGTGTKGAMIELTFQAP